MDKLEQLLDRQRDLLIRNTRQFVCRVAWQFACDCAGRSKKERTS